MDGQGIVSTTAALLIAGFTYWTQREKQKAEREKTSSESGKVAVESSILAGDYLRKELELARAQNETQRQKLNACMEQVELLRTQVIMLTKLNEAQASNYSMLKVEYELLINNK